MTFREFIHESKYETSYEKIISAVGHNKIIDTWLEMKYNSEDYVPDETPEYYLDKLSSAELIKLAQKAKV